MPCVSLRSSENNKASPDDFFKLLDPTQAFHIISKTTYQYKSPRINHMETTNDTTNEQVLLQISDHQFITSKSTLSQKGTSFQALFSNRWNNQRPDSSYFVDADPNLFEHILRLYLQLLQEARYFGIDGLREWLEEEKYLQAVKIVRSVKSLKDLESQIHEIHLANMDPEYFPHWGTRKVFVCPRGVGQHRRNPGLCGKKCVKVQGDEEVIFEDEIGLDWKGGCGE
ncbi:hypothetical protein BDV36DRAFT_296995 [Aspergillus pseudocaelatus]|uniref:BTB domain-containing protein n=1 Tax=Aspergillus pseudocaelatus TaxID=1825620 RepID=A0ABQ6WK49_9EURO|nr:hypothetical protein BDV36DRAFT_296995 [Aspergillus pseudocaelatus]